MSNAPIPARPLDYKTIAPTVPRRTPEELMLAFAPFGVGLLFTLVVRFMPFHASLNGLHWTLIWLFDAFLLLLGVSRRVGIAFARLTVLVIVGTIILVPFAWLICAAFKQQPFESTFLPPVSPDYHYSDKVNLHNFARLFEPRPSTQGPVYFWQYIINSLFISSGITFISMFFSSMGGYALAKYKFKGRAMIVVFMLASLTIPGVVLLAPNFEVIWRLGWMDTYKALMIPAAVNVFGIFLFRQAILGVPDDLVEAGRMDGCGEFRIYMTLVMPLVRPMTGAYCLISFLGAWNAFLGPNIFLQTQSRLTLPVVLNQYVGVFLQEYGVFLAGTLLAIIPPAILFLALQKEFISGLTTGAVKQ